MSLSSQSAFNPNAISMLVLLLVDKQERFTKALLMIIIDQPATLYIRHQLFSANLSSQPMLAHY